MAAAIGAKWKHVRTAALLLRAVLFVAVVEGGAVAGEDGDAEVVLDRERADYEDEREPRDVADVDALDADERQQEVEHSARGAGERVELLAEDERHFVDADVAQDAASYRRHHAEDYRAPRLVAVQYRLVEPDHHEERNGDCVEDKPRDLSADEAPPEEPNRDYRERRHDDVGRIGHPERLDAEQHVSQRPAAGGGDEADHARTEPVEALYACEPHARDRARKGADELEHAHEDVDFIRKVCHVSSDAE